MATITVLLPDAVREAVNKPSAYLVPKEVGKILNLSDEAIRKQARAGMLEYPTIITGTRVRIPKVPFLRYLGYDVTIEEAQSK